MIKKLLAVLLALALLATTALASTPPYSFDDNTSGEVAVERLLLNQNELFNRVDNVTVSATEWLANSYTPVYVSGTQFTIPADVSAQFIVNRRVRCTMTGGYVYGTIQSATYSSPNTTITLTAGILDSSLSKAELGSMTPGSDSSRPADIATLSGSETLTNKTLVSPTITGPTSSNPVLNGSVSGTGVSDDETMAAAASTTVPTTRATKAYVDNSIAALSQGEYSITLRGTAEVGSNQVLFMVGQNCSIATIRIACLTAPTGADIIVDIKKNGTSIYNVTPGNRPTITDGNTTGSAGTPDTVSLSAGDIIAVEYVQVGSGTAGANTLLNILVE